MMAQENKSKLTTLPRVRLSLACLILIISGWLAYNNVSIPSDYILQQHLLTELDKSQGRPYKFSLRDAYPGNWIRICFYGNYQGRQQILADSGIDIEESRARVWAGSETSMTFLFVTAEGRVFAQRVVDGVDFGSEDTQPANLPKCGDAQSELEIQPGQHINSGGRRSFLIFHPSRR